MKNYIGKFNCDFIARPYSKLLPIYYILDYSSERNEYFLQEFNKELELLRDLKVSVNVEIFEAVRMQLETLLKQKCDAFAPRDKANIKVQDKTTFDVYIGRMLAVAMIAIEKCDNEEDAAYALNQLFKNKEHKDVILDYYPYLLSQQAEFTRKQLRQAIFQ